MRWEGGTGVLVDAIVKKLKEMGVTILDHSPVKKVTYTSSSAIVSIKNGNDIEGRVVVFACAPPVLRHVEFEPELPPEYISLNEAMQPWSDPGYNIVLTFEKNFWKKNDLQKNYLPSPLGHRDPHASKHVAEEDRCFGAVMDLTPAKSSKGNFVFAQDSDFFFQGISVF